MVCAHAFRVIQLRVLPGLVQAFGEIWGRRNVADPVKDVKIFRNREVCVVRLYADRMWLQSGGGCRLTVFSPVDDETAGKLERVHALAACPAPNGRDHAEMNGSVKCGVARCSVVAVSRPSMRFLECLAASGSFSCE